MAIHNQALKEEIMKTVIMPGDPLRAKYIAENYLTNSKLVNQVRNMYAYTGEYKGKLITVMASGMGMPSMGIYSYELFQFYDVDYIIRIGSCGAYNKNLSLLDMILVENSYTIGNYALSSGEEEQHLISADKELNSLIEKTFEEKKMKYKKGNIACTEVFDPYIEKMEKVLAQFPKEEEIIASEMESFALFYQAKKLHKKASCLLTVVDTIFEKQSLSSEEREKSLKDMIEIALDTAVKL